jgi:dTDP-4-dehydrorhamnose reductase
MIDSKLSPMVLVRIPWGILTVKEDISDKSTILKMFEEYKPHVVVNLATQTGVRYSI